MRSCLLFAAAVLVTGCAHKPLSGSALDQVNQPAFISRIEEDAGPKSEVFRGDGAYSPKLKRLEPKEADRRLAVKLGQAMTRFEVAERLRAATFAKLPQESPWTHTIDPARVANALQSFLVDEVPANPPDYNLVAELGADAIVEFVIEDYGMRSENGKAGAFVKGYGRMFTIDGSELWHRYFQTDSLDAGIPGLDPFKVAKDKELWRDLMGTLLDGVASQFAKDLTPADRRGGMPPEKGNGELREDGDSVSPRKESDQLPPGELPAPTEEDPI